MSQPKSRLDRLLALLESGSAAVRSVAAKQIGEATKYHQDEQPYVIEKVSVLLKSNSWETRVAAGEAIYAIAQFVPSFELASGGLKKETTSSPNDSNIPADFDDLLSFQNFDVNQVLTNGMRLLGSRRDNEVDEEEDLISKTQLEKLIHKKLQLRTRIGLNGPTKFSLSQSLSASFDESIDEDILTSPTSSLTMEQIMNTPDLSTMSASERRQFNKQKRDAKKQKKRPASKKVDDRSTKRQKTSDQGSASDEGLTDNSIPLHDEDHWPFYWLAERLRADLFHSEWEIRHGAAIGLREILKSHATSAGKSSKNTTAEELEASNQAYLEDISICVLCIFIMDSFSDFVSDQMVAPVRETCAQILAIVLRHVSTPIVKNIVGVLISLSGSDQWQIRHGGLLGMKYTIAIRLKDIDELLPLVLPAIIASIDDSSDDVRSVAADSLVPVAEHVIRLAPNELVHIYEKLWNILLDLDDLSSATASVMTLLAKFYDLAGKDKSCSSIFFSSNLTSLVPRLWPFLRHNVTAVRKSSLETIHKLILNSPDYTWIFPIIRDLLCYIFQNVLLESKPEIVTLSLSVWRSIMQKLPIKVISPIVNHHITSWASLLATQVGVKMDLRQMLLPSAIRGALERSNAPPPQVLQPKSSGRGRKKSTPATTVAAQPPVQEEQKSFAMRLSVDNAEEMICMRIAACKALAQYAIACSDPQDLFHFYATVIHLLDSDWAVHKQVASYLVQGLYSENINLEIPKEITERLVRIAQNNEFSYSEMHSIYANLLADSSMLLEFYASANFDVASYYSHNPQTNTTTMNNISIEDASDIATRIYDFCVQSIAAPTARADLDNRKNRVLASVSRYTTTSITLHSEVLASVAAAIISSGNIPESIDPLVQALITSIEKEAASPTLQERSATALAKLVYYCTARDVSSNQQIATNICNILCSNIPVTTLKPVVEEPAPKKKKTAKKTATVEAPPVKTKAEIAHRGASLCLQFLTEHLQTNLFNALPTLWASTGHILCQPTTVEYIVNSNTQPVEVINALHLVTTIAPSFSPQMHHVLVQLLEYTIQMVPTLNDQILAFIALEIATLCKVVGADAMKVIIEKLLPMMADPKNPVTRRGVVSVVYKIVTVLDLDILPFIVFFVVPLLKRMSDQDQSTRELASYCFGLVIKILPLEKSAKAAPGFEEARERERKFIDQLLDNSKVEPFEIPIQINAELRQYQKDGISWMAFLNKYNLHGILCDDMGLGKTLQTICIVASDIVIRRKQYEETKNDEFIHLPSLVVCPSTLVGHWAYEIQKFCPDLHIVEYAGSSVQRQACRNQIPQSDVVIIGYEVLRSDIQALNAVQGYWNYCILDEGHTIKNKKSQITIAVKTVNANHRLILTGTPIQNNVLELWSLFDFLMPGFLGTEKEFNIRYSKPILASRDAKADTKAQAAGTAATESLHKQVLPFLLRRVKEDVLHDLPEKIIQDYVCELSPLQQKLYEEYAKSNLRQEITQDLALIASEQAESGDESKHHVFQALQYLRKVCNHPCLVLNEAHPQYQSVISDLNNKGLSLTDVSLSPKLLALHQLLLDCGIGTSVTAENEQIDFMSQHRVLIFCQLKSVLDIIEHELFKKHLPSLSYMRLDADVDPSKRFGIVHKFNSDPTIDVLLLTTQVGGLGLNLTGADTVIFVEHDWNPAADLQAMDRAHRIGQKKVVNVYRIIAKNTLEEKIMTLQHFKKNIAKSVINTESANTRSMDTDKLVNLFQVSSANANAAPSSASLGDPNSELWEEKQYEEFQLNSFLKKLE